jgi:hypothetical protein
VRAIEDIGEELRERLGAVEYVGEILDEFFRNGSCDVRVVVSGVDAETYEAIEGQVVRRFPDGELKIERVAIGLQVEWVAAPEEPRPVATIPVEAA